jgi:hypothetical protein
MENIMLALRAFLFMALFISLSACGLGVPQIGEIWDDDTGTLAIPLEKKIKEKIYCELNAAVADLNSDKEKVIPVSYQDPKNPSKTITKMIKPVPETWGATLTLTLTVEELSAFNPGAAFNTPMIPTKTYFPGGITIPGSQSYNLGIGGTISSDATRYDKYTFFYKIKDLESYNTSCGDPNPIEGSAPENYHGGSLLLESNLGIKKWLSKVADIRSSIGVSAKSSQQVLTYDVKFDIVSSGNITPTWKLVRVSTPITGLPLFNTKRERTHEMLLTLGPLSESKKEPSLLSANDALAAQIGAAVGTAVKEALSQ